MSELVTAVGVGVAVFASTNVDDMLLLAAFFSDPGLTSRQVVAGQFLGMAALVAMSTACALFAVVVPPGWIALLGIAPLLLGIRGLVLLWRADAEESSAARWSGVGSPSLAVAGVTVANGGDNLGVYIPMFSSTPRLLPLYIGVFAAMTGLWCLVGHYLVNNPVLGKTLGRWGHRALPFVLIALGLWILADARVLLGPR